MKLKFFLVLLLSIFSVTTVYADPAADKKKDEEILGLLIVLNKNEIAAANVAESKKVTPEVKDYATMMKKEHTANLDQTKKLANKLGKSIEGSDAKSLQKDGQKELSSLKSTKQDEFQKTYIDDMVKDHTDALSKLDSSIKDATNPEVKKHLEATRDHVQQHLDKAKEIQDHLSKA